MKALNIIKNILFGVTIAALVLAIAIFSIPLFTDIEYRAVRTGSMEPEIPVGSLVMVVPTAAEDIREGDDVTYVTQSNQVVTHRVLEIDRENNIYTTYGIANGADNKDAPVKYENIIGVAKFHVPAIGPAVIYLNTLSGKIIAGTVILGLFILSLLLSTIAAGKKQKKKVLKADTSAGKDDQSYLDKESSGDTDAPIQTEARKPSAIDKDIKPELEFGKNHPNYATQVKQKKRQRKETTDDFWNGGDDL